MKKILFAYSPINLDLGLLILRIGLGLIFVAHGYPKIVGGIEKWQMIGTAMSNLGITFMPAFWGFAAACSEFFGGICFMLGLGMRIAIFFLSCVMMVAFVFHMNNGDPFTVYSHPLSLLIVFISLFFMGAGNYSFGYMLSKNY
jgi:putative oxidoreductase